MSHEVQILPLMVDLNDSRLPILEIVENPDGVFNVFATGVTTDRDDDGKYTDILYAESIVPAEFANDSFKTVVNLGVRLTAVELVEMCLCIIYQALTINPDAAKKKIIDEVTKMHTELTTGDFAAILCSATPEIFDAKMRN